MDSDSMLGIEQGSKQASGVGIVARNVIEGEGCFKVIADNRVA